MQRFGLWALAALLLTACGDDDDGKSPVQKCKDLIDTFCERVTSCAVEDDLLDPSYPAGELKTDCREALSDELDCDEAVDVGDNYSECLADLQTFSCEESNSALLDDPPSFAEPPDSCGEQILFPAD